MTFEGFRKKAEEEWAAHSKKVPCTIYQEERDRFLMLYAAYTNKKLVWATWALVIVTIILGIITLFIR